MSTTESTQQVSQETNESTPVQEAVGTTPAHVEASPVSEVKSTPEEQAARNVANSQEELMKMFLAQDGKNNELAQQLAEMKKAKEELEAKWKEREDNEKLQTASKAEALSKALVEQWSNQLGADNMTEENKKAIFALAHKHPETAMPFMEIAHKASVKYAGTRSALIESEANTKKRVLEQQVVDTIMKRRRSDPAVETAHVASTKTVQQAPVSNAYNPFANSAVVQQTEQTFGEKNAFLMNALKGASQGSARSVMDSIAKYRGGI